VSPSTRRTTSPSGGRWRAGPHRPARHGATLLACLLGLFVACSHKSPARTAHPRLEASIRCEGTDPGARDLVVTRLDVRFTPDTAVRTSGAVGVSWQPGEPAVLFDPGRSTLREMATTNKPSFAADAWLAAARQGGGSLPGPLEVPSGTTAATLRFSRHPGSATGPTFHMRYFVPGGQSADLAIADTCRPL
jgi:hypothetical protein